jgi:predicted ArsR family transcriptional regulator
MKQRLLETVARSARLRILNELKRTPSGLAVGDMATRLGMSYMGVKDLCVDMEERGLLDTWRLPQKVGRPQMLYRLTTKAHELFPTASNEFTIDLLEAAQKLYGPSAPEKLLLVAMQRKADEYAGKLRGQTLPERAASLAALRDRDGHMSGVQSAESERALAIVEHHSPIFDVLRAFPIVAKLEADLFARLLGAPVRREETGVSGLYCATFWIGSNGAPTHAEP